MTITEISRSYSVKQSDGNYGSKDYFCSLSAEVGPEEDVDEVSAALFARCKEMVEREMTQVAEKTGNVNNLPLRAPAKVKFWDSPAGEVMRERINERTQDHGLDNLSGGQFNG